MNVPSFYIRNHSSHELVRVDDVDELKSRPSRPDTFAGNKEAYRKWCVDESTDHCFFSLVEPRVPTMRPSKENPPQWLHGLVVDYDGINGPESLASFVPTPYAPAFITRTFTAGNLRVVYLFERRVPVFNQEVGAKFVEGLSKLLKLGKNFAGLDEKALGDLCQFYELGTEWRSPYGKPTIPWSALNTQLEAASKKVDLGGDDIPLETVAAEAEKRFPGRWQGQFVEGARGVRFWDANADNETGAIVRKGGMQAFTGEGRFMPWSDIFGSEWVRGFNDNKFAAAIEGKYFDGRAYWVRDARGNWGTVNADTLARHLSVNHGLSRERKKGKPAEVDQVLTAIETRHKIDGAFPFHFIPDTIVEEHNEVLLNISRVRVLPAIPGPRAWGDGFPWIAEYLAQLFPDQLQRDVFLSWLHRFYKPASEGRPKRGQNLFIAGPVSAGKTFLSWQIIGNLMGGYGEATRFMLGETPFNGQLGHKPVWTIDDAVAGSSEQKHVLYTQFVKRLAANPQQEFHAKFRDATTQRWDGRLVATLNIDAESMKMLPQVENSIRDKIDMLLASDTTIDFRNAEAAVRSELPAFAAFVRDWVIPPSLLTRHSEVARFGKDSFQHPDLLSAARNASHSAGLRELLDKWKIEYFRAHSVDTEWTGTATDLIVELSNTENLREIVRSTIRSRVALGHGLSNLIKQGTEGISSKISNRGTIYAISR